MTSSKRDGGGGTSARERERSRMENARARAVARKARFDAAHRIGMKAIADRDYEMLDSALRSELSVIDEQQRDIDAMRPRPSRWRDKRR